MEKNKLLTLAVIALFLLNLGILSFMLLTRPHADRPPFGGPPPHGGPDRIIIESLHLDEKQIQQFEELKHEHHGKIIQLEKLSNDLHEKYFELLNDKIMNQKAVDSIATLIGDNRKQTELVNFEHFGKLRALCKPEQLKGYNEMIQHISRFFNSPPPRQGE